MSRKYIRQIINQDFVYPNNDVSEYDVEIVHNINDNSVSGIVNSFTSTSLTSTGITFNINATWNLNNAERFIRNSNVLNLLSVHMLAPGQDYYKPWRLITSAGSFSITATTLPVTQTFSVTPAQVGLTSFTTGTYYFEVRFIGHRAIFPVCTSLDLSLPIPTPTPTATPTLTPTATPTLTPTAPPPTPTATPAPTPTSTTPETFTIFTHGAVRGTCSDYCTDNYLIATVTNANNTYAGLTTGGYIYDQSGAGFVAYSDVSTDTSTGPFKIAEIASDGEILAIFVCSGSSCIPL